MAREAVDFMEMFRKQVAGEVMIVRDVSGNFRTHGDEFVSKGGWQLSPRGRQMPRVLAPHAVGGLLAAISSSCKDVSLSGRSTAASLLITSVQPARACPSLCVHRVMKTSEGKKKNSTQMHKTQPCNHQT